MREMDGMEHASVRFHFELVPCALCLVPIRNQKRALVNRYIGTSSAENCHSLVPCYLSTKSTTRFSGPTQNRRHHTSCRKQAEEYMYIIKVGKVLHLVTNNIQTLFPLDCLINHSITQSSHVSQSIQ